MRPVFHSSELIPFETRELDPVGAIPPRDVADNPDLCQRRSRNWNMRYVFQETILRGISPSTLGWIMTLGPYHQQMEPQKIRALAMQHSPNGISNAFRLMTHVWSTAFRPLPSRRF